MLNGDELRENYYDNFFLQSKNFQNGAMQQSSLNYP